ncbi:MAG: carboxypeptidase regulatory-like domain-containing protein [Nitrospirae bacterium]|nr:carboxypeptidase regulatory-like domain-containing protein [Nitrospirota bacterium]
MIALRLKSSFLSIFLSILAIFFLTTLDSQSMALETNGLPESYTESDTEIHAEKVIKDTYPPDAYEPDDSYGKASSITLNDSMPQKHNFHRQGDEDWIKFYGLQGEIYTFKVTNAGQKCDAVIELYDRDGVTLIKRIDDYKYGHDEMLEKLILNDGVYYVRITNYSSNDYGSGTEYDLYAYRPIAPDLIATITGFITDSVTGAAISGAIVKADNKDTHISLTNGVYLMAEPQGSYTLTFTADGYETHTQTVNVPSGEEVRVDVKLTPSAKGTPAPAVKANGGSGTVTVKQGDKLSISISLASGTMSGTSADWWLVMVSPTGVYSFDLGKVAWVPGVIATYQGGLFDLSLTAVYTTSTLQPGTYTFAFGVDTVMNGQVDSGQLYYDYVTVSVGN